MSSADTILANGVEIDSAGIGFLVPTNQIPVSTSLGIADDALILGIPGPRGQDGEMGPPGVGIVNIKIDNNSALVFNLTDGTQINIGQVIGPRGLPGNPGKSIVNSSIDAHGQLNLVFNDGSVLNVGIIVGPQGPVGPTGLSVSGVSVLPSGYLQVTMNNGSVLNAGYVVGPQGLRGPAGPAGQSTAVNAVFTVSTNPPSGGSDGDVWFQILP